MTELSGPAPANEAARLVSLLTSGLVAADLRRELWAEFPSTGRWDLFLGLSEAITILQARVTLAEKTADVAKAEAELLIDLVREDARAKIAVVKAGLAAAMAGACPNA